MKRTPRIVLSSLIGLVAGTGMGPLEDPRPKADLDAMQGGWCRVSSESNGKKRVHAEPRPLLIVTGDGFSFGVKKDGTPNGPERVKLDPSQTPAAIDLTPTDKGAGPLRGKTYPGIYRIEGDKLILCLSIDPGSPRPTGFETKGRQWLLDVYERLAPLAPQK